MISRARIEILGRVQGVFFRDFVVSKAMELGIKGWVRNTSEGTVEIVAEGERNSLEMLLEACKRGPRASRVDEVKVEWEKPTGEFSEFRKIIFLGSR